jgi:DNA-binding response OmpR family regulator
LILLARDPSAEEVLEALRAGAADILLTPFDLRNMVELVRSTGRRALARQQKRVRHRRLRCLSAKIIR